MPGGNKNIRPEDGRPFVKGDPRINRKGATPKLPEINRLLEKILSDEQNGITAAEAILRALRAKAAKGDIRAAEVLLDRAYGKAVINANVNIADLGEKLDHVWDALESEPDIT